MSTYVSKAVNPKTNKIQEAWFIDDYFGHHWYGVAFRKDGKDAVFSAEKIVYSDHDIYKIEDVEIPKEMKEAQ